MYISKIMGIELIRGCFNDIRPFVYGTFCKTKFRRNHQKTCLIFPEQDQSTKTKLRMFRFDNKLISCNKLRLVMGSLGHIMWHHQIISKTKCFEKKYALLQKITFNCLSLFCFINFGIDHGFSKQISFCTLWLKSLKQTSKKDLIRFSHSLIHIYRD